MVLCWLRLTGKENDPAKAEEAAACYGGEDKGDGREGEFDEVRLV